MTRRTYVGGVGALCAAILVSADLVAQENSYEEMSPQEQAMMQASMKYMTPGEPHQKLAAKAGNWTCTGIMRYEGTSSGNGSTIHWTCDHPDLLNGAYKKTRSVDKTLDDDHTLTTFYDTTADGREYKHMELDYRRRK